MTTDIKDFLRIIDNHFNLNENLCEKIDNMNMEKAIKFVFDFNQILDNLSNNE